MTEAMAVDTLWAIRDALDGPDNLRVVKVDQGYEILDGDTDRILTETEIEALLKDV